MVQFQIPNGMMDGRHVPDLDMLLMYGQDGSHQLIFVVREMLVELELENRFLR